MLRSPLRIALCLSLPFVTLVLYLILFSSVPQALFAQSLTHPLTKNLFNSVATTEHETPLSGLATDIASDDSVAGASVVQSRSLSNTALASTESLPNREPWLNLINYYRATANLLPVDENIAWNEAATLHARYMVKNNLLVHTEDITNPWYTAEGQATGPKSNMMGSFTYAESDEYFINSWMQAPFHALGLLSPHLATVGYGSYTENSENGLKTAAVLNVIDGIAVIPNMDMYPIMWPADGASIPLRQHTSEYPELAPSCPGYQIPMGLPIILQMGNGDRMPNVTAHSLLADGIEIESCLFHETTYTNPDPNAQSLGRAILNARDAIILIPRQPLAGGVTYTASVVVDGEIHRWSFESAGN